MIFLSIDAPDLAKPWKRFRDFRWLDEAGWSAEIWGLLPAGGLTQQGSVRTRGLSLAPWSRSLPTPCRLIISWATHVPLVARHRKHGVLWSTTTLDAVGATLARAVIPGAPPLVVQVIGRSSSHRSVPRARAGEAIERFVLRRADLVVHMGAFTSQLAAKAGTRPERLVELAQPIAWDPRDKTPAEARQSGVIACVARLERDKGVDVLIRAVANLASAYGDVRLEIGGEGAERLQLEKLVGDLGIEPFVRFHGRLKPREVKALFERSAIAVLPSRVEEGMGMVLIEAGLCGCSLVGSDLGGIRDIVIPGSTGLLVPPDNPEALAGALSRLLDDPGTAAEMGARAREVASLYIERRPAQMSAVRARVEELRVSGTVEIGRRGSTTHRNGIRRMDPLQSKLRAVRAWIRP